MADERRMEKRQQVLANFGEFALRSDDLDAVLTQACQLVAEALGTARAKVLEIEHEGRTLLVRAGVGWDAGVVGHVRLPMDEHSSETYSIEAGEPVISNDIASEDRFDVPAFLRQAGVKALANVPIFLPGGKPFGLLQVDDTTPRAFRDDDSQFLRTYATILGPVIDRLLKVQTLSATEEQFRTLMEGIPQLVWRSRDEGHWTWASPQWCAFTGQTQAESYGFGWLDALHPDDRGAARQGLDAAEGNGGLDLEHRVRRAADSAYLWHHTRSLPLHDGSGRIVEWLGTTTDVQQLKALQERQAVLVAELQHRTRNLIAVVRSIAGQTMAVTGPTEAFRAQFNDRLGALSRVQGLLSHSNEEPITLGQLLRLEFDALGAGTAGDRIRLAGPEVPLHHAVVQTLALALHELATNARKHGALATERGTLHVTWSVTKADGAEPRLRLEWVERGVELARAAQSPERRGYGRELIERALPYTLNATTRFELGDEGVRCTIDLPLTAGESA